MAFVLTVTVCVFIVLALVAVVGLVIDRSAEPAVRRD
jgi:hypothetical protein